MKQPITLVVLSTGLDNFKEIRTALSADDRVQLLAGGDDAEQLYGEIIRLKPLAAIITLGANSDQAIKLIQRLAAESPKTAPDLGAPANAPPVYCCKVQEKRKRDFSTSISPEELKALFWIA